MNITSETLLFYILIALIGIFLILLVYPGLRKG